MSSYNPNIDPRLRVIAELILLFAALVFIISVSTSCSANYHLNKAIKKGAVITTDTVIVNDTVIKEGARTQWKFYHDTIIVYKPDTIYQDKIRIITKVENDTIYQDILCPPDTVYIKTGINLNNEITAPPKQWGAGQYTIASLILLLAIAITILIIKKSPKNTNYESK